MIVNLDLGGKLWLNSAADPTDCMSFSLNDLTRAPKVTVDSRLNAAGEFRMIRTKGKQQNTQVALNFCTDVQEAWLEDHQGEPVWFRTGIGSGDRFAGYYTDSTFQPRPVGDSWIVPLTVVEITLSEAV